MKWKQDHDTQMGPLPHQTPPSTHPSRPNDNEHHGNSPPPTGGAGSATLK